MFTVKKTILDNGVRIISEEQPHAFSATIAFWLEVGSRDEAIEQCGLSHFLEHMVFKGTSKRTALDIARQIDRFGGHANAFTSKEYTCFYGRTLVESTPALIDLLSDIMLHSIIDEEELEKERGVILQEIAGMEDNPEDLAFTLFQENFWPDHALGKSILGTSNSVNFFKKADFQNYLQSYNIGSKLVVGAVGNLQHEKLVELLAPCLSNMVLNTSLSTRTSPESAVFLKVIEKETEQEHLIFGFRALSAGNPDRLTLGILNLLLGGNMSSRLFQEIREKRGLAYSVYSFVQTFRDNGLMSIYLGVPEDRVNEAIQVVKDQLQDLSSDFITEQALNDAKESLTGAILLSAENMESRSGRIARDEFIFNRQTTIKETLDILQKVSLKDILELAKQLFAPEKISLLALGPLSEGKIQWK